jgi:hypothetical protein
MANPSKELARLRGGGARCAVGQSTIERWDRGAKGGVNYRLPADRVLALKPKLKQIVPCQRADDARKPIDRSGGGVGFAAAGPAPRSGALARYPWSATPSTPTTCGPWFGKRSSATCRRISSKSQKSRKSRSEACSAVLRILLGKPLPRGDLRPRRRARSRQ